MAGLVPAISIFEVRPSRAKRRALLAGIVRTSPAMTMASPLLIYTRHGQA
jgi:hypothetical protein